MSSDTCTWHGRLTLTQKNMLAIEAARCRFCQANPGQGCVVRGTQTPTKPHALRISHANYMLCSCRPVAIA